MFYSTITYLLIIYFISLCCDLSSVFLLPVNISLVLYVKTQNKFRDLGNPCSMSFGKSSNGSRKGCPLYIFNETLLALFRWTINWLWKRQIPTKMIILASCLPMWHKASFASGCCIHATKFVTWYMQALGKCEEQNDPALHQISK